ncbi:DNA-processing protein DprA [Alkalihalobacillus hemicellulosilyticus]|uniref:Rossmann fold nucleotide-binding protein Smf n=1 Tax=Halalkalibacter hemicellulosilyticusJCM 9152 TaxID=1236971 RepID=W4QB84_9BACI|nr:DNA-processing protein DprA [Halalkalibacter hemicellulosilyticus]GAE29232.1 Rossmann fold nucleotide-binding protein Smf [Halalkalibacter hemicellulosilyticusJCM 9152]
MDDWRNRLIHLHSCRGVTWKLLYYLLKKDPDLKLIYTYTLPQLQKTFQLTDQRAKALYHDLHAYPPNNLIHQYEKQQIIPITILDSNYPPTLKTIHDPPFVLYVKGKIDYLFNSNCIAVIGTRRPSNEGSKKVYHLVGPLIKEDWTIVSGLAEGIDTLAHKAAIFYNGKTISVLGSGFHHIYPKKNEALFLEMSKKNCVISEYPPHTSARKWHFPARNRIISGLSQGVIVVEAKEKSGSLITADQALEQGRDVFAVPGSIFSDTSKGTNRLIQEGAKLILNSHDLLEELPRFHE